MSRARWAVGMMTGTSADGLDAALIRVAGVGEKMKATLAAHVHRPFKPALQARIKAAMAPATVSVDTLLDLALDLDDAHVDGWRALMKAADPAPQVDVVGVHGQTICHRPPRLPGERGGTWQLGQVARLAWEAGVPVVHDFRPADLAVGGQGAPLVPWTDVMLAKHPRRLRAVVNLGGVCNLTCVPPGGRVDDVIAADVGPCNLLLDGLMTRLTDGKKTVDRQGAWGRKGQADARLTALLHELIEAALPAPGRGPASLGREQFGAAFLGQVMLAVDGHPPEVALASAAEVIAIRLRLAVVAYALWLNSRQLGGPARAARLQRTQRWLDRQVGAPEAALAAQPVEVLLGGGGALNRSVVDAVTRRLSPAKTLSMEEALGIPAQAKEAVSFALLALARLDGVPASLPHVTGAQRPSVLGSILEVGATTRKITPS